MDLLTARVMLVEDHPFQRVLLADMLRDLGVRELTVAGDGREALAMLAAAPAPADVLVCDLEMPDMDGIELLGIVARRALARGVILISAREPEIARTAAAMVRASGLALLDYLPKPLTRARLARALARALPEPSRKAAPEAAPTAEQLGEALATGGFYALFQPKVHLDSGRFEDAEALARLQLPSGPVSPTTFIPELVRHGMIDALLYRMLDEACTALKLWESQGVRTRVCVNVSMASLATPDVVARISEAVRVAGLTPDRFVFEVTETEVMLEAVRVLGALSRLRLQGFLVAIDDFGTGHASLQMLDELPFNFLKIDQCFVQQALQSQRFAHIVHSTIELAHSLGRMVIAEGVEDEATWCYLAQNRCDVAQGYFVARPMPAAALVPWLRDWRGRVPAFCAHPAIGASVD